MAWDWIDTFMEWTAKAEPPTSFLEATAISTIAAAMERKIWVDAGFSLWYPNLYIVLDGPPATRKGTAVELGYDLISEIKSIKLGPTSITKEKLYDELEEITKKFVYLGTDYIHASYTVISPELPMFIGEKDNKFLTSLNDLWDCRKIFQYHTKNSGNNDIYNVYFNLLGCIQPSVLGKILPVEAIGGGWTSRVIFIVEDERRFYKPMEPLDNKIKNKLLIGLNEIHKAVGELKLTPDAKEFFNDWYINHQKETHLIHDEKFLYYVDRRPTHWMKIAMCMAMSRHHGQEMVISLDDLLRAQKWLFKVEQNMHNAYGSFGLNENAGLVDLIKDFVWSRSETTDQEIMSQFYRDLDLAELTKVMLTLEKMGAVTREWKAGNRCIVRKAKVKSELSD